MKSFIVALLPGLEEETGEWFDKATSDGLPQSLLNSNAHVSLGSRDTGSIG